jgi:hypothetical protein
MDDESSYDQDTQSPYAGYAGQMNRTLLTGAMNDGSDIDWDAQSPDGGQFDRSLLTGATRPYIPYSQTVPCYPERIAPNRMGRMAWATSTRLSLTPCATWSSINMATLSTPTSHLTSLLSRATLTRYVERQSPSRIVLIQD